MKELIFLLLIPHFGELKETMLIDLSVKVSVYSQIIAI